MSGYTDPIGGAPIGVANGGYTSFSMSANVTLQWPQYAVTGQPFARLMDVTPTAANLTLTMPDATLASVGEACVVNNKGGFALALLDGGGNALAVIQPSDVRYMYLMDNSSAAGLWSTVLFGRSTSAQDASQFAGPGLKAINNTLAWAPVTTLVSGSTTLDANIHRAKVVIWTGGAGALTLPDLSAVGNDFVFEFRNQGSGVCTLTPSGVQTIDSSSTLAANANEAFIVHSNSAGWYTVGRGRQTQFAFSQLVKNVAGGGGTTTLSLSEASSVVQSYIGALTGGQTVVFPAVVQVYFVSNQTTGGNNITYKCPGLGGTSVQLAPGQNAILFSDGTSVINANTTTAGLSALLLSSGSAGSPPVQIGGSGNGFYAPGTNQLGVALNGTGVVLWDASGPRYSGTAPTLQVVGSSGSAAIVVDRVSGQTGSVRIRTSGADRWAFEASNIAESGSDNGSDLNLNSYTDLGAGGTVFNIPRQTRVVNFSFLPQAAGAPLVNTSGAQALTNKTIDGSLNTLKNINLASQVVGILPAANGGAVDPGTQIAMLRAIFTTGFVCINKDDIPSFQLYYCDANGNVGSQFGTASPAVPAAIGKWRALSYCGAQHATLITTGDPSSTLNTGNLCPQGTAPGLFAFTNNAPNLSAPRFQPTP